MGTSHKLAVAMLQVEHFQIYLELPRTLKHESGGARHRLGDGVEGMRSRLSICNSLARYGGQEHMEAPRELIFSQNENYVECASMPAPP